MRIRTISVRLCEDKFEARARLFLVGQFPLAARECFLEVIMQATRVRFGVCACAAVACKREVRRLHGRLLCSQLCFRSCKIRVQISSDNALRDPRSSSLRSPWVPRRLFRLALLRSCHDFGW